MNVNEYDDYSDDDDENYDDFQNGDRVKFKGAYDDGSGEVFTLSQWDGVTGRGWVLDDDGRGWSVKGFQIEKVDDEDDEYDFDESTVSEGAYEQGYSDGLAGRRNPRASSIHGPNTEQYDSGYYAGLEQSKSKKPQTKEIQPSLYSDMSLEELEDKFNKIESRLKELRIKNHKVGITSDEREEYAKMAKDKDLMYQEIFNKKQGDTMSEMAKLRKLAGLAEADDKETCKACGGKGHKPAAYDMDRDCEKCDGTGKVKKVAEASDCDETCPMSCPDCGGTGKPKKDKVDESYPMAPYGESEDSTNVSFTQTKRMGDASVTVSANAKSMDELHRVLKLAGIDPHAADKHAEPEVDVVAVEPELDSPCGGSAPDTQQDMGMAYSTDKGVLANMIRQKMQTYLK